MRERYRNPLRTGGAVWGERRVRLKISLRTLEQLSGVHRGQLSLVEQGRLIPTAAQYEAVEAALSGVEGAPGEPLARPV